jgi:dephospho-CoA kinase
MKIIGLTGGIGSGKTTVTEFLKGKGYRVVDADLIARKIVEPGTEILHELVSHFGDVILQPDGSLNRQKLAELSFVNTTQKAVLDRITHKAILDRILKQVEIIQAQLNPALVFVDAALLVETGLYQQMDEVWLITADEAQRIQRVVARDCLDAEHVRQRIRAQLSDEQKAVHSFRIINNSGAKKDLYDTLEKILRDYETV